MTSGLKMLFFDRKLRVSTGEIIYELVNNRLIRNHGRIGSRRNVNEIRRGEHIPFYVPLEYFFAQSGPVKIANNGTRTRTEVP